MMKTVDNPSVWRLRYDVLSVRALVLLVGGAADEDLKPDVHLFLGDRYERLAECAARRGAQQRARRLKDKARRHYEQGGFDDSPRAAAMAMPVPRPRIFTDARGTRIGPGSPPDAA
jgi:hypothetical protein